MESTGPAIFDIGFVLLLAALGGWAARRLGLPAVLGYLAVGIIVSPFTPGYVTDRHQLQIFADVGVVLLLFEVGIEIDPLKIGRERARLFFLAPVQVIVTGVLTGVAALIAGLRPAGALLVGLCLALSSSVVVVNITRSRRRTTDLKTDQAMLGWSVVQDMVGVALAIAAVIALGLDGRSAGDALELALLYIVLVVAVTALVPRLLRALRQEHDLFLIFSVASALALAGVGAAVFGIPLALAAFVSGLALTESREAAEARERLLPFRDLFAVLFFVAMGALIDPGALRNGLRWLAALLALLILTKLVPVYLLARFGRLPGRALQIAIGLGQIGEFSFVLATIAVAHNLIRGDLYAAILASVVVSIAASTVLVRLVRAPAVATAT